MTIELPDWVTFPEDDWVEITAAEAGLDPKKFEAFIGGHGGQGGIFRWRGSLRPTSTAP